MKRQQNLVPPREDLEELEERLRRKGFSGEIRFSSQEALNLYSLMLLINDNVLSLDVKSELNDLVEVSKPYWGHLKTSSTHSYAADYLNLNLKGVRASYNSGNSGAWTLADKNGYLVNGQGVTIAVLDVGFQYDGGNTQRQNPDFSNWDPTVGFYRERYRRISEYDFTGNDRVVYQDEGGWHGTHAATLVAGYRGNHYGSSGVAPHANLILFRVGEGRSISRSSTVEALQHAISWGADVISMSFGGTSSSCDSDSRHYWLKETIKRGIVNVAAAGNNGQRINKCGSSSSGPYFLPASYSEVTSVGAYDNNSERSIYCCDLSSNYGPGVDIWAPGGDNNGGNVASIPTPDDTCYSNNRCGSKPNNPSNPIFSFSGTSAAAPQIAGVIALMKQVKPSLAAAEAEQILRTTGNDAPDPLVGIKAFADNAVKYLGAK